MYVYVYIEYICKEAFLVLALQWHTRLVVDPDEALWTDSRRVSHGDRQWHLPVQTAERIAMSGTRLAFIGPVFGWTDIRKQEWWSVKIIQHQCAGNGARYTEGVKWEWERNESVIAATARDHHTPGSGWGLLSLSESYRGRLCCPDSWFSPFSTGWRMHSLHEWIHQTIRLIKMILKTCQFSQNCIRAKLK